MAKKLAKLIEAPLMTTDGSLCQLQYLNQIPFKIERVYFIYVYLKVQLEVHILIRRQCKQSFAYKDQLI